MLPEDGASLHEALFRGRGGEESVAARASLGSAALVPREQCYGTLECLPPTARREARLLPRLGDHVLELLVVLRESSTYQRLLAREALGRDKATNVLHPKAASALQRSQLRWPAVEAIDDPRGRRREREREREARAQASQRQRASRQHLERMGAGRDRVRSFPLRRDAQR